tara:strand:- start:12311 stop:12622 length:312 start_codon:yes stop_codon:yes gene_type:complete
LEKIAINIIDVDGEKYAIDCVLDPALNLMEVVRDAGFPIGNCGGIALCASCHCYIEEERFFNLKSDLEEDMLDQLHDYNDNSRLICQIPLSEKLNGITITLKY